MYFMAYSAIEHVYESEELFSECEGSMSDVPNSCGSDKSERDEPSLVRSASMHSTKQYRPCPLFFSEKYREDSRRSKDVSFNEK